MIPVTYRHEAECRLYNDGEKYIYGAPWMPIDMEYVISVSHNGLEMMLNEKDEGAEQPEGESQYLNARRFYRDCVEQELKEAA